MTMRTRDAAGIATRAAAIVAALAVAAACQTTGEDASGRGMQLAEWKTVDVSEVDLNLPLLIGPKVTRADYQNRDNMMNHHRLRLDGSKGFVFTQRIPDAWYDERTEKSMADLENFKASAADLFKGDFSAIEWTGPVKHRSKKSIGYAALVDVKDPAKDRCLVAMVGYRIGKRPKYDNDEGNIDVVIQLVYCDPNVKSDDFLSALENVDQVDDRAAFAAALAAK